MDALKISQKFGAKRIAPQTVHLTRREEADRKEAWREYEISQLQIKIVLATMDHPPKGWVTICEARTTCPLQAIAGLPPDARLMVA
jgi:hypothetical protein